MKSDVRNFLTYHLKFDKTSFLGSAQDFKARFLPDEIPEHWLIVAEAVKLNCDLSYWPDGEAKTVKAGSKVLWLNTLNDVNHPEEGDVIDFDGHLISLIWLEGYHSRNETLTMNEILAVYDSHAPLLLIGDVTGNAQLTPAGKAWVKQFLTGMK